MPQKSPNNNKMFQNLQSWPEFPNKEGLLWSFDRGHALGISPDKKKQSEFKPKDIYWMRFDSVSGGIPVNPEPTVVFFWEKNHRRGVAHQ